MFRFRANGPKPKHIPLMFGIVKFAFKHLLAEWWLSLASLLGLITAIALVVSVPLYADAITYRVLSQRLSHKAFDEPTTRPSLAFKFRYVAGIHGAQWEDVQALDTYMTQEAGDDLRLPQELWVRHLQTQPFMLFPQSAASYQSANDSLARLNFASISALASEITLLEGQFPIISPETAADPVDVLVSDYLATKLGVQVGETYIAIDKDARTRQTVQIPIHISGIWSAAHPQATYWFDPPSAFDLMLLVPEQTFLGYIRAQLENEIHVAVWYLVMDGADVHAGDVQALLAHITHVQKQAQAQDARLEASPIDELHAYERSARSLTLLLYAISTPILGLILIFLNQVAMLSLERRRNEITTLRSRGATSQQIIVVFLVEGLLLGTMGLAAGLALGEMIARWMGQTHSFLTFTATTELRLGITPVAVLAGMLTAIFMLAMQILSTLEASRATMTTYKQSRSRTLKSPWWQRAYMDILLLLPAGYGAYLLRQQGSLVWPGIDADIAYDPFHNPLLFLVPVLGLVALTLIFLRLLPYMMQGAAWLAAHTQRVGLLLAARHLARMPQFYAAPLLLLVVTLALSAYTASLAQTLDQHLHDQTYYAIGTDMLLAGDDDTPSLQTGNFGDLANLATPPSVRDAPRWVFRPVSAHLDLPGVQAAARIGQYPAVAQMGQGRQAGDFLGLDRLDFPNVAFWRADFAKRSLGGLMNALTTSSDSVLVSQDWMEQHALVEGDRIRLTIDTYGQRNDVDFTIVGSFDLFPSWYPMSGPDEEEAAFKPLFVGNLDYLFEQAGGNFPYDVWLKTEEGIDFAQVAQEAFERHLRVMDWEAAPRDIARQARQPERQGLFGMLSVGFLGAAVLAVLGFNLYIFFSFHRRFFEIGILRAIGLSGAQMTALLSWEIAFLLAVGLGLGVSLGIGMSVAFIPYFQVGIGPQARIPPFSVQIAWPVIGAICALLVTLFTLTLAALMLRFWKLRLFEAIKLGESV